jgi:uncharacterized protein
MSKKIISILLNVCLVVALTAGIVAVTGCGGGTATPTKSELPKTLNLGTLNPGTIVNTRSVAIANLVTSETGMSTKVVPQTSEAVWVPMMVTQEIDLGLANANNLYLAYMGNGIFKDAAAQMKIKSFPVRVVCSGSPLFLSMLVRGDNPAKTLAETKGQRIGEYPAGSPGAQSQNAYLATVGLTMDDFTRVPIANNVPDGVNALIDNRIDLVEVSPVAALAIEAVAKTNARFLALGNSPEAAAQYAASIPSGHLETCPGGVFQGVPEPITMAQMDNVFVARADLSDDAVYAITKLLWGKNAELVKVPGCETWTTNRFLNKYPQIPYHPGAIKFYKEIGVWTQEWQDYQDKVLAAQPK